MKEIDDEVVLSEVNPSAESTDDLSKLIKELTEVKEGGNALYKQKKLDEAKNKYKEGLTKFESESSLINKESEKNEKYKEALLLYKKILSNMALCYYKQGMYKEAIDYDLKLIAIYPKFGKSIVRLIKSYSKLNLIQQSVYYGDLFLELDQETRDIFKGVQDMVQEEKDKLKKMQKEETEKIQKDIAKFIVPILVLFLGILIFFLFRKKAVK
jgi:tetratricopeptide (TPR) repeat protein